MGNELVAWLPDPAGPPRSREPVRLHPWLGASHPRDLRGRPLTFLRYGDGRVRARVLADLRQLRAVMEQPVSNGP